jgi:hypothetical protein
LDFSMMRAVTRAMVGFMFMTGPEEKEVHAKPPSRQEIHTAISYSTKRQISHICFESLHHYWRQSYTLGGLAAWREPNRLCASAPQYE